MRRRYSLLSHILRQGEIEGRASAEFTLNPNPSAVALDNVLDNGKPQTRTPLFARPRFVNTIESLKYTLQRLRWNSGTVILDGYFHLSIITGACANRDSALRPAVLDGVID